MRRLGRSENYAGGGFWLMGAIDGHWTRSKRRAVHYWQGGTAVLRVAGAERRHEHETECCETVAVILDRCHLII
jgi:hypothetical protein